jgi:hypothetical protein
MSSWSIIKFWLLGGDMSFHPEVLVLDYKTTPRYNIPENLNMKRRIVLVADRPRLESAEAAGLQSRVHVKKR